MIAKGIAEYLDSEGVATLGTDLFVSAMPDTPDDCVAVYDEPGAVLPENHYDNSDSFGTMIKVRGSHAFIRDRMTAIHRHVAGLGNIELDGFFLVDTRIQTPPADIGSDEKGRREYTAHYEHYTKIGNNVHRTNN